MTDVQMEIKKIKNNGLSSDEILTYLDSELILVRLNAILAVVRLDLKNEEIILCLSSIAKRISKESQVFGLWNNGHFAFAALKLLNTKTSINKYEELLSNLNDTTKFDIERLINQWSEIM